MTKKELDAIKAEAKELADDPQNIGQLMALSIQLQAEMLVQFSKLRRQGVEQILQAIGMSANVMADVVDRVEGRLAITNYEIVEDDKEDSDEEADVQAGSGTE